MNVAYNALSLRRGDGGGAATFTLNLLARLPAALPEASFTVYVREGEDRIGDTPQITVRSIGGVGSAAARVMAETLALGLAIRRDQSSVLFSPNESIPLRSPCPVVVVAQNLVYHATQPGYRGDSLRTQLLARAQSLYYRTVMGAAYKRAAAVVAVSHETARVLSQCAGLDPSKTSVVLEGANSVLLPASAARRSSNTILIVSAFAPYKNLERALEIFKLLQKDDSTLELAIIGSDWNGYRRVIERRVASLGLDRVVRVDSNASGHDLAEMYAVSRMLWLLSDCESFGLPVVEAMSRGLPVAIADRSSLPEVAGGAALVVDPYQPEQAAKTIGRALRSPEALEELARRGRARAAELTWERSADSIADVLRAVANTGERS